MLDQIAGLRIMVSTTIREQYRFPRTKKRRIRNKWSARDENWRPSRKALQTDSTLYMHPEFYAKLKAASFGC